MRRRSLLNKPYDCELTYIESTGTQYIDTGILLHDVPNTEYKIDIKFMPYSGANCSCYVNAMYEVSPYPGTVLRKSCSNSNYVEWGGHNYNTNFIKINKKIKIELTT